MEEILDFSDALSRMKNGEKVKLKQWANDVFISLQFPDANSKMTAPYMYVTSRFGMVPWNPTQIELLSEDWEVL